MPKDKQINYFCDHFRKCENFGDAFRHGHFVDAEIGVGRDDSTRRKVHTFARQIATKATSFALSGADGESG